MINERIVTENAVLKVYKKHSPSLKNLPSNTEFNIYQDSRHIFFEQIGIIPNFFSQKKLLDIGGGTGEHSLFYAAQNADVTIVEPNELSCEISSSLFRKNNLPLNIYNQSIYDFNFALMRNFDVIIIDGVLQHLHQPLTILSKIVSSMKKGSYIFIAMSEKSGHFKRDLQRKLVYKLAGNSEEKIVEISKKFFQKHIDRAVCFGQRSEMSVIYDEFVNPQEEGQSLKDILDILYLNKIFHLGAYPSLDFPLDSRPLNQFVENKFNYSYYKNYYQLLEKVWMTCGQNSVENILESLDLPKLFSKVDIEVSELKKLESSIENLSFSNEELKIIQEGYLGVGENLFWGIKK